LNSIPIGEGGKTMENDSFLENSKYILSSSGWTSKEVVSLRKKALLRALKKYPKKSVIDALEWVSIRWKDQSPEVTEKCEEDIKWINDNWEKGIKIKKRYMEKGIDIP